MEKLGPDLVVLEELAEVVNRKPTQPEKCQVYTTIVVENLLGNFVTGWCKGMRERTACGGSKSSCNWPRFYRGKQ